MPHRSFPDQHGNEWEVWDTRPDPRSQVSPRYRDGWLTFETSGPPRQKRRLSPVPPLWNVASDEELLGMLVRAESVKVLSPRVEKGGGDVTPPASA